MTANQFAETYRFTTNDKAVVNKMYGSIEKSEEGWYKLLSADFVFSKKEFILNKVSKAKEENINNTIQDIKQIKKTKKS